MAVKAHEAATMLGLTVPALHYYEKAGLLPEIQRNRQGNRIYSQEDIEWIRMVVLMRQTGISIQDIRTYTKLMKQGPETIASRYEFVKKYKEAIEEKIQMMQDSLEWMNIKMEFYEEMMQYPDSCTSFLEESAMVRERMGIPVSISKEGAGNDE